MSEKESLLEKIKSEVTEQNLEPLNVAEPETSVSEASESETSEAETTEIETIKIATENEPEVTENEVESVSDEASSTSKFKEIPYHERYYLKYREGKRNAPMDLEGTKTFLQQMGFDGGELRQARAGKACAEGFNNMEDTKGNKICCSYCGREISGVEFSRLPDGRVRCNTCSNTILNSKAEVEALCQRVLNNMDSFFGATIDVPISIEVTDERKLKKKIGVPLGTKDEQSMLILGVAINKKNDYSIVLENGAPRLSVIATFAHELTHIWQYTHWDANKNLKKCPKEKHLLIYEGMAKWVEIQYLYLIGETNVAKREEYITRNRQDEYGIGFCLYEDKYPLSRETMICEETPFTPNSYPFD